MRVIVCGSRKWTYTQAIYTRLALLPVTTQLVHGHCPTGADVIADDYARANGWPKPETHPAIWSKYGAPRAAHIRNQEMADAGASLCIAFVDKPSGGTWDMVKRAKKAGIPVEIIRECGLEGKG